MTHNMKTRQMEIVEFTDGTFGLRMKYLNRYLFKDLKHDVTLQGYWWQINSTHFNDAKGSLTKVKEVFETLKREELEKTKPKPARDIGTPWTPDSPKKSWLSRIFSFSSSSEL